MIKYLKETIRQEFIKYLNQLTDDQVRRVYHKELQKGRRQFADLAHLEMERRGIEDSE